MSFFVDLKLVCPVLAVPGDAAAEALGADPLFARSNLALFGEYLIRAIYTFDGFEEQPGLPGPTRLNKLNNRGMFPSILLPFFHILCGTNETDPPGATAQARASLLLKLAVRLAVWFAKSYGPHLPRTVQTAQDAEHAFQIIGASRPSETVRRSSAVLLCPGKVSRSYPQAARPFTHPCRKHTNN
jgi:hypothetical protein